MTPKVIKAFVLGVMTAYLLAALVLVSSAKLGLLPVQADVTPSALETSLLGSALHASVARRAGTGIERVPSSTEDFMAGAKLYRRMCSRCHGESKESDDTYGRSFYPPAPQLALDQMPYTDSELFWIVKHGIRNTAMPSWGKILSDDQIWEVVTFLRKYTSEPD